MTSSKSTVSIAIHSTPSFSIFHQWPINKQNEAVFLFHSFSDFLKFLATFVLIARLPTAWLRSKSLTDLPQFWCGKKLVAILIKNLKGHIKIALLRTSTTCSCLKWKPLTFYNHLITLSNVWEWKQKSMLKSAMTAITEGTDWLVYESNGTFCCFCHTTKNKHDVGNYPKK